VTILICHIRSHYFRDVATLRTKGYFSTKPLELNPFNDPFSFYIQGVLRLRKRVTLMVIAVSFIFGICWLPESTLYVLEFFSSYSPSDEVCAAATMLIMFNAAVNPFVYALLNQRFKQKLKGLVSCNFHPRNKVCKGHCCKCWEVKDDTTNRKGVKIKIK